MMAFKKFSRPARWSVLASPLLALALSGCIGGLFGGGGDDGETPTIGQRIPVLSQVQTDAEVDPQLAGISVILPPATRNPEWAQAGGAPGNNPGHLQLAEAPSRAWTARIAGTGDRRRLADAPVVGGGRLYVVDTDGVVHAFDAATGARAWQYRMDVPSGIRASAFGGGASYTSVGGQGRVFATNGIGEVIALDAGTGAEVWKAKPAGPLRGAPTLAFNSVYVMTQDNQIHALSAADGSPLWSESGAATQAGVFGVAAPAAGQGSVVAGYSSGELGAYRYENGRLLWADALARTSMSTEVASLTDIDADPIIDDGRVYALGQGGRMAAYELVTGQRVWELNLSGISTPAIAGEWLFTLTDDARLLAIARSTGRVRWITQLPRFRDEEDRKGPIFWTGPVLAGNQLWIASSRGQVARVSVGEGAVTEFAELNDGVSLPPIIADGTLYVLDDGGTIHAWQ